MSLTWLRRWIRPLRLPSTVLGLSTILLGNFLALAAGSYQQGVGLLAIVTAILLQIIANLANDYGDFLHGAGVGGRVGPAGEAGISLLQLKRILVVCICLAAVGGSLLLKIAHLSHLTLVAFMLLGVAAIIAAIGYTMGSKPYAYLGLGDIVVFLFFGPVGVLGTVYLHTHTLHSTYLLPAASGGMLAVAVLNVNNIRDSVEDARVSKKTLVVRLGSQVGLYYQWGLLISSMVALIIFTSLAYQGPWQWLFMGAFPLLIHNGILTTRYSGDRLNKVLGQLVLLYLCIVILFGMGLLWSR